MHITTRKLAAAAVTGAAYAALLVALALFEVRREPAHPGGAAYLLADAVYEHCILEERRLLRAHKGA